ncbi:MAG: hypothetical protein AB2L24_00905 [Mangrovibacterium sp.]
MYFKDNSQITSENLKEELFHAVQDAYYPCGIAQYSNVGYSNIEFEAKLYKDVIALGCCTMFPADPEQFPELNDIKSEYYVLLDEIREQGCSTFTSESYESWVNLFRQYNPNTPYAGPVSGDFSDTNLLNTLLSGCNN